MKLPVIDFSKCAISRLTTNRKDVKDVGERIFDAFANVGFAYLKNVGVKQNEISRTLAVSKKFFDLEEDVKKRYNIGTDCFGYVGSGVERNSNKRPGDYKECFDIVGTACVVNHTNWPDNEVQGFSTEMKAFSESCRVLATRMLAALSLGMEIKNENYLADSHSRMNSMGNLTTLRTNYYPPVPKDVPLLPDQVRLGEHTDFGSFTILFQDRHGGLQVKTTDGHYVDATPIPDTVLVNVGDALQFWTRGLLRSTEHRILMPKSDDENVERRSLAYFVQANNEIRLSEIEYKNSTCSPMSISPTVFEYLTEQYKSINLQNLEDYSENEKAV